MKQWILLILMLTPLGASAQQIDALQNDSIYLSLLSTERTLKHAEDSLLTLVHTQRLSLRADTSDLARRSQEILRAEETIFEIRNQLGIIASRINGMEQQYLLDHLFSRPEANAPTPAEAPNLVDNAWFKDNLTAEEYAELKASDAARARIVALVERYKTTCGELQDIAVKYSETTLPAVSDSLYGVYRNKTAEIRRLESDFQAAWGDRFNQEIYLYSYLLDKLNRTDDLAALNERSRSGAESTSKVLSETFAAYPFQRELILEYQLALARALNLSAAVDSLERSRVTESETLAFAPVEITEREFVDFEDVSFPKPSPYDSEHPIPELLIPETGRYYSVLVGTFAQRQGVPMFRGAAPIRFERLDNGQWRYYIGLFRSYDEAAGAVDRLKEAGFRRPEPVRWLNGAYENLTEKATENEGLFRIRIENTTGELDPTVRTLLDRYARSKEITRTEKHFYVATFTNRLHTDDVMEALRKIDGIQAAVEEIDE
jgi:hypothetical protein